MAAGLGGAHRRCGSLQAHAACLHGAMAIAPPIPADPRPHLADCRIDGSACAACGHVAARQHDRCERCLGSTTPKSFGPGGTVWSSTTVHLRIGDLAPPFVLAYVDIDGGPRVLARIVDAIEIPAGGAVRFVGDDNGDLLVEAVAS